MELVGLRMALQRPSVLKSSDSKPGWHFDGRLRFDKGPYDAHHIIFHLFHLCFCCVLTVVYLFFPGYIERPLGLTKKFIDNVVLIISRQRVFL